MTQIQVWVNGQEIAILSPRARAMFLTLLALLAQVDAVPTGQLRMSWGQESAEVKWVLESHGRGLRDLGGTS